MKHMNIPLRRDTEYGLTPAQFAAMPDRLRAKAETLSESGDTDLATEAARLVADVPVWEAAAKQLEGQDGKWSIVWAKVGKEVEDEVAEAAAPDDMVADATDLIEAAFAEYGRRNSMADLVLIQSAHDLLAALGAECGEEEGEDEDEGEEPEAMTEVLVEVGAEPAEPMTFEEATADAEVVTLREADPEFDRENMEVWITPIRPGPGNKRDNFFYPAETIKEAVEAGRFDNIKMFANHPTRSGEKELPERSVKDWVGVIKETVWDESRQRPRSRLKVLDRDVFDRFEAAPEHIAFSVLGGGRARPGRVNGESKRIVESMDKVRSVDWVTEAGAGGGIDFAESADEEFDMDIKSLTVEQVREGNPALYAAIREDEEPEPVETEEPEDEDEGEDEAGGGAGDASAEPPAPEAFVSRADFEALQNELQSIKAKEAEAEAHTRAMQVVEERLRKTAVPRSVREYVMDHFAEATVGEGMLFEDIPTLAAIVDDEIVAVAKVAEHKPVSLVRGLGSEEGEVTISLREAKEAAIEGRLGKEPMPSPDRNDGEEGASASADTSKAGSWKDEI